MTIAMRNAALPHGKNRKTTKSALATSETTPIGRQPASPRTARAIVNGAAHTHRDDQQKRDAVHPTVPRHWATAAQHRRIDPKPGQDQRHPKQGEQHDRETARPPARQLIAYRDCEDDDQQPVMTKVATCVHPYGPRANELGHGTCPPPTNSQPSW